MHIHINHCFCYDSIWGGHFDCCFMVVIPKYFPQYEHGDKAHEDWTRLIDEIPLPVRELYDPLHTNRIKPEVLKWLGKNAKDNLQQGEKGFAVGSDDYNSKGIMDFKVFFYRRSDAMRFIKRWSVFQKPTTYFDYFKEIRKQYNFKTKTLQKVKKLDYY
jgi:hypothetical protein